MIVILVVIDDHVDDFNPTMQCSARTNEEIVFVEHLQYVILEFFQKPMLFLQYRKQDLTCVFNE
jgi:hypothetical protein